MPLSLGGLRRKDADTHRGRQQRSRWNFACFVPWAGGTYTNIGTVRPSGGCLQLHQNWQCVTDRKERVVFCTPKNCLTTINISYTHSMALWRVPCLCHHYFSLGHIYANTALLLEPALSPGCSHSFGWHAVLWHCHCTAHYLLLHYHLHKCC